MDDLLQFSGNVSKIIVETAQIHRGTFTDREGKRTLLVEANFNVGGETLSNVYKDKVENYVYYKGEMICLHVAKPDKTPIDKTDYYYEQSLLTKKIKVNDLGIVTEEESFYYDVDGNLIKKESKFMTYEYIYQNNLLVEERWHSDFSLNQIIRYTYDDGLLTEIAHFSGEDIPGRKIEYKRERLGFITEIIIYSASNLIVSHTKFEYVTIFKKNWLKRIKYSLHTQNRRKEANEVQYRDLKFHEQPKQKHIVVDTLEKLENDEENTDKEIDIPENNSVSELEFKNGTYKGEIVEGEMHGQGSYIFNTGTRYQGSFKNNVMEGKGKLTYINGKVYEGTFYNNVLEGPGACKWENGDFYVGEFENGKMHGRGCYIWENGNRFDGLFENNLRTEQGILYKKSELESNAPPEWVNDLFK